MRGMYREYIMLASTLPKWDCRTVITYCEPWRWERIEITDPSTISIWTTVEEIFKFENLMSKTESPLERISELEGPLAEEYKKEILKPNISIKEMCEINERFLKILKEDLMEKLKEKIYF